MSGTGTARVIQLQPGQILTRSELVGVEGDNIPDLDRDLLLLLVCSRYRPGRYGIGLVQGFGLQEGALAGSVAHDAHNVVAVGADRPSLKTALEAVISHQGGMAAVSGGDTRFLPLDCAGLMSSAPFEEVVEHLHGLDDQVRRMGGIDHAFMYLSFLTLTVVPELRLTEKGLFEVASRTWVPLFVP
jgi:adenine deaminase